MNLQFVKEHSKQGSNKKVMSDRKLNRKSTLTQSNVKSLKTEYSSLNKE